MCVSFFSYCCDKMLLAKSTQGRKGLFWLTVLRRIHHHGNKAAGACSGWLHCISKQGTESIQCLLAPSPCHSVLSQSSEGLPRSTNKIKIPWTPSKCSRKLTSSVVLDSVSTNRTRCYGKYSKSLLLSWNRVSHCSSGWPSSGFSLLSVGLQAWTIMPSLKFFN